MSIQIKRAYERPSESDGYRVLVDRIWPRGIRKEDAAISEWLKEIAPSKGLREWFGHEPERWDEFRIRYFEELGNHPDAITALRKKAGAGPVTLVYAAKDELHNNAVALKEHLEKKG